MLYPHNLLRERLRYLFLVFPAQLAFLIHFVVKVTLGDARHSLGEITMWLIGLTVSIVYLSQNRLIKCLNPLDIV